MRWQLLGTWLIGSLVGGTMALLLHTSSPDMPVTPLVLLSGAEFLTLVVLVGGLSIGLFALGWRTIEATWLRWQDPRSAVLWATLVASVGFAGWGFAGVVTFEAGFSFTTQLILAYTCGGLPFTLVAALLARPWRVNAVAFAVTIVAVLTGFALMDAPLQTLVLYLQYFFSGPFRLS
jgi:hypothetical protein